MCVIPPLSSWHFSIDWHRAFMSIRKPVDFPISLFSHTGYRIRLGSSTDKKDTGRLHVDYAQARDDLYEWECRQRMLAREERHRRRIEEDRLRPPSPPPIVHYSEHECSQLGEKIKGAHFIILIELVSVFLLFCSFLFFFISILYIKDVCFLQTDMVCFCGSKRCLSRWV